MEVMVHWPFLSVRKKVRLSPSEAGVEIPCRSRCCRQRRGDNLRLDLVNQHFVRECVRIIEAMRQAGAALWPKLRALQVYGANTGVGKTIFSSILCRAFQKRSPKVYYLKPISTGPQNEADDQYVFNILFSLVQTTFRVIWTSNGLLQDRCLNPNTNPNDGRQCGRQVTRLQSSIKPEQECPSKLSIPIL